MTTPGEHGRAEVTDFDQRVVLHGISWRQLDEFLRMRGDDPTVRIAYREGELELMSPSNPHEKIKKRIAALLEAWLNQSGIVFDGVGSWTLRSERTRRGIEPDECYTIGRAAQEGSIPDLALEVVWTSGGIDKLDVYRGIGVREIWVWEAGHLSVFELGPDGYVHHSSSRLLPDLDVTLLARFVDAPSQSDAVRGFLAALRAS